MTCVQSPRLSPLIPPTALLSPRGWGGGGLALDTLSVQLAAAAVKLHHALIFAPRADSPGEAGSYQASNFLGIEREIPKSLILQCSDLQPPPPLAPTTPVPVLSHCITFNCLIVTICLSLCAY